MCRKLCWCSSVFPLAFFLQLPSAWSCRISGSLNPNPTVLAALAWIWFPVPCVGHILKVWSSNCEAVFYFVQHAFSSPVFPRAVDFVGLWILTGRQDTWHPGFPDLTLRSWTQRLQGWWASSCPALLMRYDSESHNAYRCMDTEAFPVSVCSAAWWQCCFFQKCCV